MRAAWTVSCLFVGAFALAACSKPAPKPTTPAASGSTPAAGKAAVADEPLGAEVPIGSLPAVKAGYWEATITSAGKRAENEHACESGRRVPITMGEACSKVTLHKSALGAFTLEAQCGAKGMSLHMLMKAKGDFQSHYTIDNTSTLKMEGQPEQVDTSHREVRYVGACPAGMRPSDD